MTEKITRMVRNVRSRMFEGIEIISASAVFAYDCGSPACHHAHLIGLDEDDIPICEIKISEADINKLHDMMADRGRKRGH